jgi:putative PIN family toxin of toxin-antitoxin system
MIRAVLDTNIIISATILKEGHSVQVLDLWRRGQATISPQILEEVTEVIQRPRITKQQWIKEKEAGELVRKLWESSIVSLGRLGLKVVKEDPEDDNFLICALEAGADYIVSGDPHLKKLKNLEESKLSRPGSF